MPRTSVTTLVVDNHPDALRTVERLTSAEQAAFDVTQVASVGEARAWLSTHRCDLVLTELTLPDASALDVVRQLVSPARPLVVVAGSPAEALRPSALAEGVAEVISKEHVASPLFALSVLYVVERHRAREREERLAKVLDTTPDAIVVVDRAGGLQYVNSQALTFFGRDRDELAQERLTFSAPEGTPVELRVPRPSGERVGEMRVADLEWNGAPASLAAIRDITLQRNLEMQLVMADRLASLGTLAAGVAHEINNPLAVVVANLSLAVETLAQQTPVDVELTEALADARDAAERIRCIVRDVKVFSRTEEQVRGAFDVHSILESVVRMARNEVQHRAQLVRDFGEVKPVLVNEARVSQVFLNLLVNAAQAIPEGRVAANEIRLVTRMQGPSHVAIEFRDTGPGIPPEVRKRLFTPFFTTKPVGLGTGLGLAISQRIVHTLGGEISFDSEVGRGTNFRVVLPVADSVPSKRPPPASLNGNRVKKRVMAVDDEPAILNWLRRSLGHTHELALFERARPALDCLRGGERFDVILCDLMMPELSGMTFCDEVERLDSAQASRIILMTGGAFTPQSRELLGQTRYQTLEKPFSLTALQQLVEAASLFETG